ncbi:MAG: glycosyltransferase family 4 protein [Dehalococcoidia bacterium]|nr:glycosyltransferase family 4 protein [Dehalococcoidia bacterium]
MSRTRPRILFVGSGFAGNMTEFLNMREYVEHDDRIEPVFALVSGYREGGLIERLGFAPSSLRYRLRALCEGMAMAQIPRPDAIWFAASVPITPYLWAQIGPLHRPLVLDTDSTSEQREAWAPEYYGRPPRRGLHRAIDAWHERFAWRRASAIIARSNWAAAPIMAAGIAADRVHVIPFSINVASWATERTPSAASDQRPLRLLFVGGDLERKGGDVLAEVVRGRFAGRCELDLVTHGALAESPGIRVHRAKPNSLELRALYAQADIFVLPTKAECFGIATVEAMASGLPVIMGDAGAAREIVDEGETGWLVQPYAGAIAEALERALVNRRALPAMGQRAREVARERFDCGRNDRRIVDIVLAGIARNGHRRASQPPVAGQAPDSVTDAVRRQ